MKNIGSCLPLIPCLLFRSVDGALRHQIGNVLLLEDPDSNGQGFHPKIALHFTYSFKELDEQAKAALDKIYIHLLG